MSDTKAKAPSANEYRITATSGWAGAWKKAAGVGAIGLAASLYGMTAAPERFPFSYMFALFGFLSIGLGALFFVMVQHITKAGWSVSVRRTAEFFMAGLPIFALLVLPILLPGTMSKLFPWVDAGHGEQAAPSASSGAHNAGPAASHAGGGGHGDHSGDHSGTGGQHMGPAHGATGLALEPWAVRTPGAEGPPVDPRALEKAHAEEHAHILKGKAPYLNKTFFYIRAIGYVLVWIWLASRFFGWSIGQDKGKATKLENSKAAQSFAPQGLMLFALTITFAAFDWLMSLDPMWYSTIFGVYIFAGSCVVNMANLILSTMLLRRSGLLGNAVNVEHYHDMGKLMFGWLVFWAYISFSQFFLIWYSNIPEELVFFHRRWNDNAGTWRTIGLSLIVAHFAIPFWLLMSRNVKRGLTGLAVGAMLLVIMHFVEMYWIVLPNFGPLAFHWLDVTCFLGVGGIYLAVVLHRMEGHPLIPVGDPRLVRALKFENA